MRSFLRTVLTFYVAFLCVNSFAQPPEVSLNSATIIKQGIEFYGQQKYKEAIAEYLKIPRNDTNYTTVLHDLSLIYYADSNFIAAKNMATQGLQFYPEKADDWYNLIANNYDKLGDHKLAIAYYDSIISNYQFAFLAWFNKGITYYNLNQLGEAKKCLQQAVLINPYYTAAHYQLGIIAMEEGNLVPAILSFTSNLLMDPENKYAGNSVTRLNNIAKMSDEVVKKVAAKKASAGDDFELIHEIVASKVALDPQYKLKAVLEDPIVRQLQVVFEKLAYQKNDKGFWMQYYVPYYEQLFQSGHFEPFINYIFSGLDIKAVKAYVKKNQKLINAFTPAATQYFNGIKETQALNPEARGTQQVRYLFVNGKLSGKGKIEGEGEKASSVGPWEYYYSNGALQAKGEFKYKNEKTGLWQFYHKNGRLKEKTTYVNDKPEGKTLSWFNNGQLAGEYAYKNGMLDGKVVEMFYNGLLKRTANYLADKKEGTEVGYAANGVKTFIINYKNDKEDSIATYYHKNGKISSTTIYKNVEADGAFKNYYVNGSLKMEGAFASGKRTGTWREYFNDGNIKAEYAYNNGEMEGAYIENYSNGKPMIKSVYAKDKLDGKYEDYALDGKLYSNSVYEKGRLKDLKFYDKNDKVISSVSLRSSAANLAYYNEDGNKTVEGNFTKDGFRTGKTTWYYASGKVSAIATYKDGLLEGEKLNYYRNGVVSGKVNYKENEEDGYKILYYINGNKQYEGMMVNGEPDGVHIAYDEFGNILSKTNYLNNEVEGFLEYYHPNGKLEMEQFFTTGWITNVKQYDTLGKQLYNLDINNDNAVYRLKKYTGANYVEGNYKGHYLNGQHKVLYNDKYANSIYTYRYGIVDSAIKVYYYGGKLQNEGQYKMGERDGKWTYYHENGKLYYTETYDNGRLNGVTKLYSDNGTLDKEITYVEGEVEGEYRMFGEDGKIAIVLNYRQGKIISYTYEDKDGKLLPAIPLKVETTTITAFFKSGTKSAEFTIEDGEFNGARKLYFSTGKLYVDGGRVYGFDHGIKKVYLPDGSLQKEQNYHYDKLHGLQKTFYANGKVASEENWYNGEMHGDNKYYDTTGRLLETRSYYYGSLQAVKK